jgi:large subunit ribosomal protein L19
MNLILTKYNSKSHFLKFKSGDTIIVHIKVVEGNKERIQQFEGIVIQRKSINTDNETFTVRKISNGVGVEKIFPIYSPMLHDIKVKKVGIVRRSKLYYLRKLSGKATRLKQRFNSHG